ncbi:hypothetical protein [Flavobacterium limi]|uniref:Tetratricopeptide repeat-containing protein n=1 Tax=Flavobacterium limi TaxID=2045105 RepID=A0ABQ1URK6_9FLAO|nr:hypothetical protein [Flavobacterium limi]GGF23513.1 hypothetical protein GCM10011518_36030 [Flavobacterium limi]
MKILFTIILSIFFISCKNEHEDVYEHEHEACEEADKVSIEMRKFDDYLVTLYKESESNSENVIKKSDSLFIVNKKETEKYKSQIKSNIESKLHYLKAEIFYKIGKYKESITELNFENNKTGDAAIAYAANYIKLKDFKTAKSFIDSIGNWNGDEYALGNYYESTGNKTSALKTYRKTIEQDKSRKHFAYYKWTLKRVGELEKGKPLLNEIFFPTGNPSFEICDSDNENRTKIMKLMQNLPESKGWNGIAILESPQENEKDYYWVRVDIEKGKEFNYYIYQKTFKIKFFDPKSKKLIVLEDWRKSRKNGL